MSSLWMGNNNISWATGSLEILSRQQEPEFCYDLFPTHWVSLPESAATSCEVQPHSIINVMDVCMSCTMEGVCGPAD
jgi:hypothetical protein